MREREKTSPSPVLPSFVYLKSFYGKWDFLKLSNEKAFSPAERWEKSFELYKLIKFSSCSLAFQFLYWISMEWFYFSFFSSPSMRFFFSKGFLLIFFLLAFSFLFFYLLEILTFIRCFLLSTIFYRTINFPVFPFQGEI